MAWQTADRVKETTTTTGTGAITLAGAMTGYRAFSSVCSVGDTCYYGLAAVDGNQNPSGVWEVGIGTYSATNTLTRTTVLASSNAGAAVTLPAGTTQVWIDMPAAALYPQSTVCAFQANNSGTQSLAASTATTLTGWTSLKDDSGGAWNASTGVFTAPVAGWYSVNAAMLLTSATYAAANVVSLSLLVNGTGVQSGRFPIFAAAATPVQCQLNDTVYLTAGQTLSLQGFQNTVGAIALAGNAPGNWFSVALLSAVH